VLRFSAAVPAIEFAAELGHDDRKCAGTLFDRNCLIAAVVGPRVLARLP
jgi:hypothetical protein